MATTITELNNREKFYYSLYKDIINRYPRALKVSDGTSNTVALNPKLFFKECLQDGNRTHNWQMEQGAHTFLYDEGVGTLDDYAEVLCYRLARNLGTREVLDYAGNIKTVPVVNCAEYQLAVLIKEINGAEYPHRGCVSTNVAQPGETLIKGSKILEPLKDPDKPLQKVRNSLANHRKGLQIFKERQEAATHREVVFDPNIETDLLINAYMCYRVSNSDNHSNNIMYTQSFLPDGRILISVSPMIDNGAAWEMSTPPCISNYKGIIERNTNENGEFVLTDSPFKHQAFHLDAGGLNGHSKKIDGKDLSQEFEFAAHALSNPNFYDALFRFEQRFDLRQAFKELTFDYRSKFPSEVLQVTLADSELKASFMTQAVSNYFCYTAFKSCIGEVDEENPSELYTLFQSQMSALPLQPSIQGYIDAFKEIAQSQNIEITDEQLSNLDFLPQDDLSQTDGLVE